MKREHDDLLSYSMSRSWSTSWTTICWWIWEYRNSSIFSAIQYQTNLVVCNSRECERIWWWHANFVGARPQLLVTEYVVRVTKQRRRHIWRESFRRQRRPEKFMTLIFLKLTFTFQSCVWFCKQFSCIF